jgi:8-oxo-dGTP diphosphatase/2-hydroxy-dATP diphosphatase
MKPEWFNIDEIPFDKMWEDDPLWFPSMLKNEKFNLRCCFETNAGKPFCFLKLIFVNIL